MKNLRYLLAALGALFLVMPLGSHGQESQVRQQMRKKLSHAQKVLAGIALNDFDQIAKNADELIFISKSVEFRVLKTPTYEMYSHEFRRAAESMVRDAKKKNLDGAALAYVDLTLTCVKCHKHVREVRETRLPDDPSSAKAVGSAQRP